MKNSKKASMTLKNSKKLLFFTLIIKNTTIK